MRGNNSFVSSPWIRYIIVLLMVFITLAGCAVAQSQSPTATSTTRTITTTTGTPVILPAAALPSIPDIVQSVLPSVVYIQVDTSSSGFGGQSSVAIGSGVIMRPDGYILTNKHVIDGGRSVQVIFSDGHLFNADNVYQDDFIDLAVVKINAQNLPTIPWGNPDAIRVGDWVIALGSALGLSPSEGGSTVTVGVVSNLDRSFPIDSTNYYDMIQTDAAINSGNSGGALVNLNGELVGINSAGVSGAENVGFAINVGLARHVFEDLVQYGKSHHPFLGVSAQDVTASTVSRGICNQNQFEGAIIDTVDSGSPAATAGLKVNDVITSFTGNKVTSAGDLVKWLLRKDVGDQVDVEVCRGNSMSKVTITLGQRPAGSTAI